MQVLTMPALSPTMNAGNVLEWNKKVRQQGRGLRGEIAGMGRRGGCSPWVWQGVAYGSKAMTPRGVQQVPCGGGEVDLWVGRESIGGCEVFLVQGIVLGIALGIMLGGSHPGRTSHFRSDTSWVA